MTLLLFSAPSRSHLCVHLCGFLKALISLIWDLVVFIWTYSLFWILAPKHVATRQLHEVVYMFVAQSTVLFIQLSGGISEGVRRDWTEILARAV